MNGTAKNIIGDKRPPAIAARLGMKAAQYAAKRPDKNNTMINIALIIGPVIHWILK